MKVVLLDRDDPHSRYLSRFWTAFSVRSGMFTTIERVRREHPAGSISYFHPDAAYETLAAAMLGVSPARTTAGVQGAAGPDTIAKHFDIVIPSEQVAAPALIGALGQTIADDFAKEVGALRATAMDAGSLTIVGDRKDVSVHASAEILPGSVLDAREGPIVIGADAKISPFTYIRGPAVIGTGAYVDNCRIVGPVVIGTKCRVGGEVEASIVGDFSNKHHEGFLGHSIVGRWVNIGAMSTTSDLKNNYGSVNLTVPQTFFGLPGEIANASTGRLKFGSVISDCVKIGICMRMTTGSVIDAGSCLFDAGIPKYTPMFSWGDVRARYKLDRFIQDCTTIFARRRETVTPEFINMATFLSKGQPDEPLR